MTEPISFSILFICLVVIAAIGFGIAYGIIVSRDANMPDIDDITEDDDDKSVPGMRP